MQLKIYDETHKKVKRTVQSEEYDLFFGTVEAVTELIDVDKMSNNFDVIKTVIKSKNEIVRLLKDVFPNVTDEEWKLVKVKDMAFVLIEIVKTTVSGVNMLSSKKN